MKNVLLIGDSIRIGYDKYVKMAFEGVANIKSPEENCRWAAYILRTLYDWYNWMDLKDIDCIHWNAGLWDNLVLLDGKHLTPIDQYCEYIDRICNLMQQLFPKANMIFATSTAVLEHKFTDYKRFNKDTKLYNDAAAKIVKSYGGTINDLFAITENIPESYYSDRTHLNTKEGAILLSTKVIEAIEEAIGIKANKLDYDRLFAEVNNVVGI